MARFVKKTRRRKMYFSTKCGIVLSVAVIAWLFVSVFVTSINTNLTIEIQNMKSELATIKTENQQLNIDIQTLQNKERVYTIARDAGLNQNQDNVVSVTGDFSEAE